jgi:hypothetical protein
MALGQAVALRLTAYSVLLLFLAAGVFGALMGGGGSGSAGTSGGAWVPELYLAAYLGTVIAHEVVHGLFFLFAGGRPRYGAGLSHFVPYFYATSPGRFTPRRMIVVGLAPLVVLSALSLAGAFALPALVGFFAVVFVGNAAGAVGDVWMALRLRAFVPLADASVSDLGDRMDVYSSDPRVEAIAAALSVRDVRPVGFVVRWLMGSVTVLAVSGLVGSVALFVTDSLLIGPASLPLVAVRKSAEGASISFGVIPPLLAGLLFAMGTSLLRRLGSSGRGGSRPVA